MGPIVEGADYLFDMRTHREGRSYNPRILGDIIDTKVDEDYMTFLYNLEEFCGMEFMELEEAEKEEDVEEDADPHYKMFLECLKEHRTAYDLDFEDNGGESIHINYEYEDDFFGEPKRKAPYQKHALVRETKALEMDNTSGFRDANTHRHGSKILRDTLRVKREDLLDEPGYKLSHSYGNDKQERQDRRVLRNTSSMKRSDLVDMPCWKSGHLRRQDKKSSHLHRKAGQERQNPENLRIISSMKRSDVLNKPHKKSKRSWRQDKQVRVGCTGDETYSKFLNGIQRVKGSLRFLDDSTQVKYGEHEENLSFSKFKASDSSSDDYERKPNLIDDYESKPILTDYQKKMNSDRQKMFHSSNKLDKQIDHQSINGINLQLKERLINLLKKPYDGNELNDLWAKAKCKKHKIRYKDMRGGISKPYKTNELGRSYLDSYPALGKEIKAAKSDLPKILNLLRGFFFYLQHCCHGGIKPPWRDESCKSIMPGSK